MRFLSVRGRALRGDIEIIYCVICFPLGPSFALCLFKQLEELHFFCVVLFLLTTVELLIAP